MAWSPCSRDNATLPSSIFCILVPSALLYRCPPLKISQNEQSSISKDVDSTLAYYLRLLLAKLGPVNIAVQQLFSELKEAKTQKAFSCFPHCRYLSSHNDLILGEKDK